MKQFDYLLLIDGEVLDLQESEFITRVGEIEQIQLVQRIDVEKLKSKENLIFE